MTIDIQIHNSLNQLKEQEYCALKDECNGSIFYDIRFLRATEQAHLLPIEKVYYLVAYKNSQMIAFMSVYLQAGADPFGVLNKTTAIEFDNSSALFGHIMHCYESMILARENSVELYTLMLKSLASLAKQHGIKYFGILNTLDENLMHAAKQINLKVNYMWDRFYVDFSSIGTFDEFLAQLNREGRQSFNRQLRKFAQAKGKVIFEKPPIVNLQEVVELCYETTKKHGTEHYYPKDAMYKFIHTCGDLVRILSVYWAGKRVAAGVCFLESDKLHLWACGMIYDDVPFSPYIIAIAEAFKYALENNIRIVEIGRTNGKIKKKLGFSARQLYSIINNTKADEIL